MASRFRLPACLVLAVLLVAGAAGARADLIKLKDGRTLEGRILSETDDEIKFEMPRATQTIQRRDVVEIIKQKSSLDVLDEKLHDLNPNEPARYLETGKWCLAELKRDDLGLRMVSTAMALDPQQLYTEGQIFLGDYFLKKEKLRAAQHYIRALLADPNNPTCAEKFEQVKEAVQQVLKGDDRNLLKGINHVCDQQYDEALDALMTGKRSSLRGRAEELLGMPIEGLMAYCETQIPCRTCKGKHEISCPECKGDGAKECKSCGGKGKRKRMSAKGTDEIKCKECEGWGNILCRRCKARRTSGAGVTPDTRSNRAIDGGSITCVTCKGKSPPPRPAPQPNQLQECQTFLDRRLSGSMTPYEQTETRMVRVGGAALIDGAEELIATPVWWEDRWVSVEERASLDPAFKAKTGTDEEAYAAIRKSATPLQGDASNAVASLEKIRQLFGVGTVSPTVAQQVHVTEFGNKPPAGEDAASGPYVEIDPAAGLLRPCLVQAGQQFSTQRVVLTGGSGMGIPVSRVPDLARFASSTTTLVRIYYSVADSKEDILPQSDRDVGLHHLIVKVHLVDFVDSTGRIVKSTH